MNNNLTDITLVIDRSGSMESCRTDAEGGVNAFVREQAAQPRSTNLTLVQFDNAYECVHYGVPIADAGHYTLVPRGNTALLDAIGRAIIETGTRLSAIPEDDRPGLVVFAIVTDGMENASTDFDSRRIAEMIDEQTNKWNWQFTYLGANQDAFEVASSMGIAPASTMNYATSHSQKTYAALSANVSRMADYQMNGLPIANQYTDEERAEAIGEESEPDKPGRTKLLSRILKR